jgi:hypothetical protein
MKRYFTPRCMVLHLVALVLVPAFLLLGRWQLSAALGGNELSWTYVVEWPAFALMVIYMWWRLIHDQRTPLDRLWAERKRAEADASGAALYQIPGWALDKSLRESVKEQSEELARTMALPEAERAVALDSEQHRALLAQMREAQLLDERSLPAEASSSADEVRDVVDARVLAEKAIVREGDKELEEYNRYLFRLSRYEDG